jgi:hypothetical protein
MKSDNEYTPYEKWSRQDFKTAYEEADALLKEAVKERNELREKIKEAESWQASNRMWMQHAIILGRVLDILIQKPSRS